MPEPVSLRHGRLTAAVDPMGAQLLNLQLDGREYRWQGDPRLWARRAPVLFPIVGSLRDGRAESAQGPCVMGRHGIARNYEHAVIDRAADGSSVTFELRDSAETRAAYPYDFKLNMTYAITGEATLSQTFRVTNTGDATLPFCVGGHPAFNVPMGDAADETFEDYVLKFARPWSCTLPVIDSVLTLLGTKSGHGVRIDFPGFPYIGVWSAANDAPFVALEPWSGHTTAHDEDDVFEHKAGMTLLAPGETNERTFHLTLF